VYNPVVELWESLTTGYNKTYMKHQRKIIYLAGFIFSIPIALTSYINSSFLQLFTNQYTIALLYVLASLGTLVVLVTIARILRQFGNRTVTIATGVISLVSFLVLGLANNFFLLALAFTLYFVSFNILWLCLDIFIEDFSKNSQTGSIRGLYLSITSLAWVIAQVVSGSVIAKSSLRGAYVLSALFILLVIAIFSMFFKDYKDAPYKKTSFIRGVKSSLTNKNISKIYLVNLLLKFFYAWMVIYMPIYLHTHIGFDWSEIGVIFSIMLIPFVVMEYPLGKLSDRIGEKKMLIAGFVVAILATGALSFINLPILYLFAAVLFLTRVGAATIEVMSETYFFKLVEEEDAEIIGFFRNTTPLSYIIAPLLAIPVLYFTPSLKYLFMILAAFLSMGLLASLRLRDVK